MQAGFTLTGTLDFVGSKNTLGNGDNSYVQVAVGSVILPDTEAPVVSNVEVSPMPVLLNGDATVTASIDDTGKGNNPLAGAEYRIDGTGSWNPMEAADGTFDEISEDVAATYTATTVGTHEVCVRGTDSAGITSAGTNCQSYLADYKFADFYSPVDNAPLVNVAKAGPGIPLKWLLTDASGVPISDPASFVAAYSYPVSCTDFAGDQTDSIEEYAAGSSGLQYIGDGYWQFNWKTPKSYANSCRAIYVGFDSGGGSPAAFFQFK